MSGETAIEWTDATWNPTTGCDRVSPGCDHCYAMTLAVRLKAMGSAAYQLDGDPKTSGPGFQAHEWPRALEWPLHKKKPLRIFVNSMSDLFHDNISDEYIARVFAVMALAPQHTFQVLTKRHARMRALLSAPSFEAAAAQASHAYRSMGPSDWEARWTWPLKNVWLGVSVENQQWADIRIPALLSTPAAVRFLSCEPLLGPVDLDTAAYLWETENGHGTGIDWVIAGGESGPGARPMKVEWARQLRQQTIGAGVSFLFKQWGSHAPFDQMTQTGRDVVERKLQTHVGPESQHYIFEVGKKAAGRRLDGRTWDEYPAVSA